MARVFTEGFEFDDLLFWTIYNGSVTSSSPRSGTYCYQITSSGSSYKSITAISEAYFRFGYKTTGADNGDIIFRLRSSTTNIMSIYTHALTHVVADVNGSIVEDSGVALTANIWHLFEVYFKMNDSGKITVYLDGIKIIDYSGDTKPGSDTTFDNIYIERNTSNLYWDDFAMNDTTGGSDNSYCGDGHIELLTPNEDGDVNNWTGSDADKVDNYLLVDDIPSDNDTTYVKSNTSLEQDMYSLTDFSGSGKIITRIFAECRAKDNDATSGQIKLGFKTGGTVYLCSSARTLSGNYARVVGDDAVINPADSGAWEDADLDGLQLVFECE